jgi:hypothetical protein
VKKTGITKFTSLKRATKQFRNQTRLSSSTRKLLNWHHIWSSEYSSKLFQLKTQKPSQILNLALNQPNHLNRLNLFLLSISPNNKCTNLFAPNVLYSACNHNVLIFYFFLTQTMFLILMFIIDKYILPTFID